MKHLFLLSIPLGTFNITDLSAVLDLLCTLRGSWLGLDILHFDDEVSGSCVPFLDLRKIATVAGNSYVALKAVADR